MSPKFIQETVTEYYVLKLLSAKVSRNCVCIVGIKVGIQEKHFVVKTCPEVKAQINGPVRNVEYKDEGTLCGEMPTSEAKSEGALRSLDFNPVSYRDFQGEN